MDPLLIIGIIALLPVIILTLFRANAATAFLALALGSLLGSYVGGDIVEMLRGYVSPDTNFTESVVRLVLLWLPVFLVSVFMAQTITPRQRLVNLLPALCVGLVGVLLSVPFLTPAVQQVVEQHGLWDLMKSNQALFVGGATIISLALLRLHKSGAAGKGRKH